MLNLYSLSLKKESPIESVWNKDSSSILYHDLFDYPLSFSDLIKWHTSKNVVSGRDVQIVSNRGFYFLKGREGLIYKRLLRKRISVKKMAIAKKAAKLISFIPGVRMVGVTGSLAMENSSENSDIDLMIISSNGRLWSTRALIYFLIGLSGIRRRRPNDRDQKDKLCLNMWLDEGDSVWNERNLYTAHEISQIIPLVNKNKSYEKFLSKNKWILNFWPNAVKIQKLKLGKVNSKIRLNLLEMFFYKIQLNHMKSKMTREIVTPTRAIFHPQDWGKVVMSRLAT